ncbi:heterokaryon incompatibility protein-domain-containing protein [Rhypophila decipiens]|uniref:Heterokaryon incompatibility protein-domain-containing protein n=1 Tax=Rhypophila decipiens TaxID=261697 RepID=A0AAN7B2U5_9PEZI|nr:heterokaryon incompatibility protein-domain-containing protein [Rhypophila decipiens]
MRTSIEECVDLHGHTPLDQAFYPDRLLDVRCDPVRLVRKVDIVGNGASGSGRNAPPYSTLSYCWGSESEAQGQLKTTTATFPERLSGIKFEQMPPVLQDAVSLTRRLSIPYLWIDALCILQDPDDSTDWEKQSSVMNKIYGNSLVTLAAISSSSCQQHFCHRDKRIVRVQFKSDLCEDISGVIEIRFNQSTISSPYGFGSAHGVLRQSRWRSRGWTFPESYASTRLLALSMSDAFLICPSGLQYSGKPGGFLTDFNSCLGNIAWYIKDPEYFNEHWLRLATTYSQHAGADAFTQPTDALPAISGIARLFSSYLRQRPGDYLAGLWRRYMLHGLMWTRRRIYEQPKGLRDYITVVPSRQCGEYVCPSWSWIGKDVAAFGYNYGIYDHRPACRSLDGEVQQKGTQPYGKINSAVLLFHGNLAALPFNLERDDSFSSFRTQCRPWIMRPCGTSPRDHVTNYKWEFELDWVPPPEWSGDSELRMALLGSYTYNEDPESDEGSSEAEESESMEESGVEDSEGSEPEQDNTNRADSSGEDDNENNQWFWGLLLYEVGPTTIQEEHGYVRVGIFRSCTRQIQPKDEAIRYFEEFGEVTQIKIF